MKGEERELGKIRILFVDDEVFVTRVFKRVVENSRREVTAFTNPVGALEHLRQSPYYHIIVSDYKMEPMNGLEFLQRAAEVNPLAVRVLLTGYADMEIVVEAINKVRIHKLILKPWKKEDLEEVLEDAWLISTFNAFSEDIQTSISNSLDISFSEITAKLDFISRQTVLKNTGGGVKQNYLVKIAAIKALSSILNAFELKDPFTVGHSAQVARFTAVIAKEIGYVSDMIGELTISAFLHDIGKLSVPERILFKKGRLTPEEFKEMKKHPEYGAKIVEGLEWPPMLKNVILQHHEWYNGSGYPKGLKGEEISVEGRIAMVADSISAMVQNRSYRQRRTVEEVIEELRRNSGTQFDPEIAQVALKIIPDLYNLNVKPHDVNEILKLNDVEYERVELWRV